LLLLLVAAFIFVDVVIGVGFVANAYTVGACNTIT